MPPPLPPRRQAANDARYSTDWIAAPPPLPHHPEQQQPPALPIAAPSVAAPIPVIPLAYAEPSLPTRPAGLMIIGILSLLIGMVSALATSSGLYYVCSRYAGSVPPPPPPPLAPLPPVAITPHAGDFVREWGLKQPQREIVMQGVAQRTALPPDRAILLERFLADVGRKAFGDPPFTAADIARDISETGQVPGSGVDGDGELATHFIVTSSGRIELDNALARFGQGNPRAGFTVAGIGAGGITLDGNFLTIETGARVWGAAALNEWVERIANRPGRPTLTAQQAAVVLQHASTMSAASSYGRGRSYNNHFTFQPVPDPGLYVPGGGTSNLGTANVVHMNLAGGLLYILPDGRNTAASPAIIGIGPAPDCLPIGPRQMTFFQPKLPGSLNAIHASIAVEVVALVLAIALIIAAVRTLAGSRGAAGLHILWAIVKIVFCFIALAVGVWWSSSMPARYGVAFATPQFLVQGMGMAVVSLIYPGVVLAIMNSSAVRDYYRSIGQPMWLFSPQRRSAWRLEFAEIMASLPGRAILCGVLAASVLAGASQFFAAVYAIVGGGSGRFAGTQSGAHLFAIVIAAACACSAWWLMKWAQQTKRSVMKALPGFDGGQA